MGQMPLAAAQVERVFLLLLRALPSHTLVVVVAGYGLVAHPELAEVAAAEQVAL